MSSGAKVGAGKLGRGDGAFDLASYAPVAERITLFYETFPRGRIITELVSRTDRDVVFRALVYRDAGDADAAATGWAAEREGDGEINTVACLENTETSAIGRALANLGFTASRERPSAEEMAKASRVRAAAEQPAPAGIYPLGRTRTAGTPASRTVPNASMTNPVVADLLSLITRAERAGLRAKRATRWRAIVASGALAPETLLRCERRLRLWIHAPRRRGRN
jgi:hypothetical protein